MTSSEPAAVAAQRRRLHEWIERHHADELVRFVETHVSILAIGSEHVWKLKKAVRFPFVDLSTVALRRRNAEREVALNRRFAPDVYLGVVPLAGEDDEVVVEMRRMPDDRRLSVIATDTSESAFVCIDAIASVLARVHAAAPFGDEIDRAADRDAVLELWHTNLDEIRALAGSVVDARMLDRVESDVDGYAAGRESLFSERIAKGRIRDGHGDLLADDVFCLDDRPRLLDCLEFDDRLRFADVIADVAFLAMDLERLGRSDLASWLFESYRRESGDSWPESLADFYVAYRASVRAKVACLSVGAEQPQAAATARDLLTLAAQHLAHGRVRLVLVGGPPATGKTTLARELALRTGWTVVHSDEVRKRLAGLEPTTSAEAELDAGLYSSEWTARTYESMIETAHALLAQGESVVLDASWSDVEQRGHAARLAAETSSALHAFRLSIPEEVAENRARARTALRNDASDASARLTGPLGARFADWPDAIEVDATKGLGVLADSVLAQVG